MRRTLAAAATVLVFALVATALTIAPVGAQGRAEAWRVEQEGFEFGVPDRIRERALRARTVRADLDADRRPLLGHRGAAGGEQDGDEGERSDAHGGLLGDVSRRTARPAGSSRNPQPDRIAPTLDSVETT